MNVTSVWSYMDLVILILSVIGVITIMTLVIRSYRKKYNTVLEKTLEDPNLVVSAAFQSLIESHNETVNDMKSTISIMGNNIDELKAENRQLMEKLDKSNTILTKHELLMIEIEKLLKEINKGKINR